MRIDYPVQQSSHLIQSLHDALNQAGDAQFAMLMSLMYVKQGQQSVSEMPVSEKKQVEVETPSVNGAAFLETILKSQSSLR
jgi:hypothetical protein